MYVEVEPHGDAIVVHSRWEDTPLPRPRPAVLEVLRRMSLGPVTLDNVVHDDADRRELAGLLDRLPHLVVRSIGIDAEQPLMSVVPLTPQARFRPPAGPLVQPVRLSRFALVRSEGGNYLVESPLSLYRVVLHHADAMGQLGPLSRPVVPTSVEPGTQIMIHYLIATGMVVEAIGEGPFHAVEFAEDADPALAPWSPADLMFHTRSNLGRHDYDYGATYPMGEQANIEPVVKLRSAHTPIRLPRPAWDDLIAADPPLSTVIEGSRPSRHYGRRPLTLAELGELLYRTVRIRGLVGSADEPTTSDRPYLNAGGCSELEVYATVDRCEGLPRGVYHYDPLSHGLESIDVDPDDVDQLLGMAHVAANLSQWPPVVLTLTARFRRLSWKYNGLSYSLVLKNVGALTQTLTLVADAMGLAACWLDSGDMDISARVFGIDWRVESSVGGFVVGHRDATADTDPADRHAVNDADWAIRSRAARDTT